MRRIGLVGLVWWSLLALLQGQRLIVPGDEGLSPYMGYGGGYLSPDGKVLLMRFHTRITYRHHPAIWTLQDGWWYLKPDGGLTRNPREAIWGYADAISYDGSVVLGYDRAVDRPFRWRRGQGIEYLQRPPGASAAVGIFLSWDGGWVVGRVAFWRGDRQEWWLARWSPEGRVELIEDYFSPYDISASGRELVGVYGYFYACHWREGEGLRLFWEPFTNAWSVSADGRIAAGRYVDRNPQRFCVGRWFVDEGRMECADTPPWVRMASISADGRVMAGTYDHDPDTGETSGFIWEEGRGWFRVDEVYGWLFGENESYGVIEMSADGRYILVDIVTPSFPEGYRLSAYAILDRFGVHGDVTGDDCVDDADLLRVLFAFGREGWRPEDLNVDRVVDEEDVLMLLSRFGECAN